MPCAVQRSDAKEQHWRQVVADLQASGSGVTNYCRQKGIKVGQFDDWQRKIRDRDAEQSASNRLRMAARAKKIAEKAKREKRRSVEFVEVQVVDREQKAFVPTPRMRIGKTFSCHP